MAIPSLYQMPKAPSRSDPANFDELADNWTAALSVFGASMQACTTAINGLIGNLATATVGTSSTSLAVGTGSKALTVQAGLAFAPGQRVRIAATTNPATQYMTGNVTSYDAATGALVVAVDSATGTSTLSAWSVFAVTYICDGHGEVSVVYVDASTIKMVPVGMGRLKVYSAVDGWQSRALSWAGVTLPLLAIAGAAKDTLYHVYAYIGAAGLALETSTTGYVVDTSSGGPVWVKSGDPSRTLVASVTLTSAVQYAPDRVVSRYNPPAGSAQGECRMVMADATTLRLDPVGAGRMRIWSTQDGGWIDWLCPAEGVTLRSTGIAGVAASTLYGVYAYLGPQGLTLDAGSAAHARDAGSGYEVKVGDVSHLLAGMVRTNGSTQFQDDARARLVASWFNRRLRVAIGKMAVNRSTASSTMVEAMVSIEHPEIVMWGGDRLNMFTSGDGIPDQNWPGYVGIALDSTTTSNAKAPCGCLGQHHPAVCNYISYPGEGYHYGTIMFQNANSYGFTLMADTMLVMEAFI